MKRIIHLSIALVLILSIFACGSSKNYDQAMKIPEKLFYQGKYKEAARKLLPEVNNSGKDQLLFMMECGMMLHAAGDYKTSNKVLLPAAKLAKLMPTSITKQAASFLTNDTNSNYRGEDFEKVLVHMYLGLNFLMLKDYEEARVEFKSVNNELSKIRSENGQARYKQNLMAKYLTAVAFEMVGNENDDEKDLEYAYVEYKQIYSLDPSLDFVKEDLLRMSKKLGFDDDYAEWRKKFRRSYNISKDYGEVLTVFQSGRSAVKKSRGSLLKNSDIGPAIRLTLRTSSLKVGVTAAAILVTLKSAENPIPKFVRRSNRVDRVRVSVKGRSEYTTVMEDVENTAVKNLEDDYSRLYKRVAASIVIKSATAIAAGIAAKAAAKRIKKLGGFAGLIGAAVGAGTGALLFSNMKPDLRCWHTLPANLQFGRMFLPAGKHLVKFSLLGRGGVISTVEKEVEIKKGRKTLVNLRTLF